MLNTAVGIQSPAALGGGSYSLNLFFQTAAKASFVRVGDTVKDSVGNEYSITTWSTHPSDFSSGGSMTLSYITSDVLPVVDVGFNSSIFTPNQVDVRPIIRTPGSLYSISLVSGQNFEYQLSASWTINSEALQAIVGDRVVDSLGKEFEITFLDTGQFTDPFKVKEVESEGTSPAVGAATLYRPTPNFDFFQGSELTDPARTNIFNRDKFLIDSQLQSGGSGSGTALETTLDNNSGSLIAAELPVCSVSGGMETVDVATEAEIFALAGITKEAVNNSTTGTIVTHGLLEDVSISGNVDDPVFISKSGGLTTTKPSLGVGGFVAGDFVVQVGVLLENQSNPANKDLKINFTLQGQL